MPDARWYHPDSRLDCMSVVPVTRGGKTKYYGYATGPGGFLESDDGLRWSGRPRPPSTGTPFRRRPPEGRRRI